MCKKLFYSFRSLLDIWMLMCIVFVFIVLIHFVVVISLLRTNNKKTADYVEKMGAIIIPFLFACFNAVYWTHLVFDATHHHDFFAGFFNLSLI